MNRRAGASNAGYATEGETGGMPHALLLGASLAIFWLLLSGYFTSPLLLGFGVISVAFTTWLSLRIDRHDGERVALRVDLPLLRYWGWLLVEILKANLDVAKLILAPRLALSPRLVRVKATQATDTGVVIYANSITLTPGTVTIDIDGDELIVHAITQDMADGVLNGDMGDRVTALGAR